MHVQSDVTNYKSAAWRHRCNYHVTGLSTNNNNRENIYSLRSIHPHASWRTEKWKQQLPAACWVRLNVMTLEVTLCVNISRSCISYRVRLTHRLRPACSRSPALICHYMYTRHDNFINSLGKVVIVAQTSLFTV